MSNTLFDFAAPTPTDDFTAAEFRLVSYETARNIIEPNHYLRSLGSTVVAVGMFLNCELAGVATYGTIPGRNARGVCGPEHAGKVLELTRLFIHDWAGKNAESTLIGASFSMLKAQAVANGGQVLVSYADTAAGHVGTIYQATNWLYAGVSVASKVVMPDGRIVHGRVARDPRRGAFATGFPTVKGDPKHRYVTFVGDRRQVRGLRAALKWPVLPYPK